MMIMKITVDTVVKIKRTMFELFLLGVLDLFSCVAKQTVLSVAASIQGRFLFFLINSCGFYLRAVSIQENKVLQNRRLN